MVARQLYNPGFIGNEAVDVASMGEELNRISAEFSGLDQRAPISGALLQGQPLSFTLDATPKTLTFYGNKAVGPGFPGSVDDAAGTISVGRGATLRIGAHVAGVQGNNSFNEAAQLQLVRDGVPITLATYEIPNNKTSDRSWNAAMTLIQEGGPVVYSLALVATSGLGVFTFTTASFELQVFELR